VAFLEEDIVFKKFVLYSSSSFIRGGLIKEELLYNTNYLNTIFSSRETTHQVFIAERDYCTLLTF
jgi:hypothetical protein